MTFSGLEDTAPQPAPPTSRVGVPWTWRDVIVGITGVLLLLVLLAAAAYPLLDHYGEDSTGGRLTQAAVNGAWYLVTILLVYLIVSRKGASWSELGLRAPPAGSSAKAWLGLLRAVVIFLLTAYSLVFLYGVLVEIFGLDFLEPSQQLPDDTFDSDAVVIATGALVILGAPIAEEVLFRGFLFAKLRMHLPFVLASALSGGLFSLAHADPGLIIPFTIVGMLLAYVYERTGTLCGSIGVHFCFNTITFLILVLIPEAR
jgi:membrane protease YdiL (CAAX protease family)